MYDLSANREFGQDTYPSLMVSEASTGRLKAWGLELPEGSFIHVLTLTVSWGLTKTVIQSTPSAFSMWPAFPHNRVDGFQGQMSYEWKEKKKSRNHIAFYGLALGVTRHYFCHILKVTKVHPGPKGGNIEPTYWWKSVCIHSNKNMWDGIPIGVAIVGKYLSRSSRNTALCYCVGTGLNLMRHWEHVTQITQNASQSSSWQFVFWIAHRNITSNYPEPSTLRGIQLC